MIPNESVLDLYCGMGGLGTGFSRHFRVANAVDAWHDACQTYQLNHRQTDVKESTVDRFLDSCIPKDFEGLLYNGIIGGPPCQEFSVLNRHKRPFSSRANQLFIFLEAIDQLRPEFALIENVATIPKPLKEQAVAMLKALDYHVVSKTVLAHHYGSVQKRRRWILTASKFRAVFPAPLATRRQAKEILRGYEPYKPMALDIQAQLQDLPCGKWVSLPGKQWKEYFIVDPDQPLPAIVNVLKNFIVRPDRKGFVSLPEICLAQGFHEDYQLFGSLPSKAQQLANAVPVELSATFAAAFYHHYYPNASQIDHWV